MGEGPAAHECPSLVRCSRCGLVSEGLRCERCNAPKVQSCAGSCGMCGQPECPEPDVKDRRGL